MSHPSAAWAGPTPAGARVVEDPDELVDFYSDAPAAHIYALVDSEPPWFPLSRWYRRGEAIVGLISDTPGELLTAYAVATRDAAATIDLLADIAAWLPSGLLITGPLGFAEVLAADRDLAWSGPHERYVLDVLTSDTPKLDAGAELAPLGYRDVAEIEALYTVDPGAAFFIPSMLADATFVGVRVDGRLVAAAGTHLLSEQKGLAAIGSVFVHPEHRGRSFGEAVTRGVIDRLGERIDTVGLNVSSENAPARRIYERLGFRQILTYEEAELA